MVCGKIKKNVGGRAEEGGKMTLREKIEEMITAKCWEDRPWLMAGQILKEIKKEVMKAIKEQKDTINYKDGILIEEDFNRQGQSIWNSCVNSILETVKRLFEEEK